MGKTIFLIRKKFRRYRVNKDDVMEFERAILAGENTKLLDADSFPRNLISSISSFISRVIERAGLNIQLKIPFFNKNKNYISILLGLHFTKCLPYYWFSAVKSIYLFDAWPDRHKKIVKFIRNHRVDNVFISSSQARAILSDKYSECTFYWIPEGVDPANYRYKSYSEKDIDVLQLGRKYDLHHNIIVSELEQNNKTYLYEKKKGKVIFPSRENFIEGLARTKISICVPSSITHPERAGHISTMTMRYLQSMISKCLVLGHAPNEMIELFGYNPVIEIDIDKAPSQIMDLINNYDNYIPLVEKNYEIVKSNHTWLNRWGKISNILHKK